MYFMKMVVQKSSRTTIYYQYEKSRQKKAELDSIRTFFRLFQSA